MLAVVRLTLSRQRSVEGVESAAWNALEGAINTPPVLAAFDPVFGPPGAELSVQGPDAADVGAPAPHRRRRLNAAVRQLVRLRRYRVETRVNPRFSSTFRPLSGSNIRWITRPYTPRNMVFTG